MGILQNKLNQNLKTKLRNKLIAAIKLTNFIDFPEIEFSKFIKNVENDPLFKKLKIKKLISYQRLVKAGLSSNFLQLKEEISVSNSKVDLESLLKNKEKIIQIIRELGITKFKQYFLYDNINLSLQEISRKTGLVISKIKKINSLINEISIHSEFHHPSLIGSGGKKHYFRIASIEKTGENSFIIGYFVPDYVKGKYLISYEKIKEAKKSNFFSKEEIEKTDKLLKDLNLINIRKTTIHQVIQSGIEIQSDYLCSEDIENLISFTQRDLSAKLKISSSLICRLIGNKSIVLPWGEEKPLKDFFPSKKKIIKILVKKITNNKKAHYTDEKIKNKLKNEFAVNISRRSVNVYRKELEIYSGDKKKK
ncbi:hypothetical protein KAU39_07360 [bacterium]|nr:hypothetical protein [bacterium]